MLGENIKLKVQEGSWLVQVLRNGTLPCMDNLLSTLTDSTQGL